MSSNSGIVYQNYNKQKLIQHELTQSKFEDSFIYDIEEKIKKQ